MSTTVKALPTTYAGVEFRSRLEARTAMLLDQHGVNWHYEAEGFELSDGTRYLPDFWLPATRTYIEVKGQNAPGVEKAEQFAAEVVGDDWTHPTNMVLIATLDRRERWAWKWWDGTFIDQGARVRVCDPGWTRDAANDQRFDALRLVNALGASVFGTDCPACSTLQWVNIGAWRCRTCSFDLTDHVHGKPEREHDDRAHPPTPSGTTFGSAMELPRLPQWTPAR